MSFRTRNPLILRSSEVMVRSVLKTIGFEKGECAVLVHAANSGLSAL
jgi:hypothetical protein